MQRLLAVGAPQCVVLTRERFHLPRRRRSRTAAAASDKVPLGPDTGAAAVLAMPATGLGLYLAFELADLLVLLA